MPQLVIDKDFLAGFPKLETTVQKAVLETIGKFGEHTHAGLHLEKLRNAKDPNIRTIRITQFWRGVVLAPPRGDTFTLLRVMPHDDAIAYARSRLFSVNQKLGVLDVRNQEALEAIEPAFQQSSASSWLFEGFKDSTLARLGIDARTLSVARRLHTLFELETLESLLPELQYRALFGLALGYDADTVWQEISNELVGGKPPTIIDVDDLAAAAVRTPDRYVKVSGPDELADILAKPFAAWRLFLHHKQRDIAYRPSFRGSVLVSGGAGTGKTVTAVHRAAFLAGATWPEEGVADILLTTFTRPLADGLQTQVASLISDERRRARIDVLNVNRLAYKIVAEARGRPPEIVDSNTLRGLWTRAARKVDNKFSATFLEREWEQVVLAQEITDLVGYLRCERLGRGRGISRAQKSVVWTAMNEVQFELLRLRRVTHTQVLDDAARILKERDKPPYRHVLVDEAQDLHPAHWRLLRAAVAPGPDDLFIAADPNQRIYDNRVTLGSLGIKVVGRSYRLTVNYRTTQEILNWAVQLLGKTPAEGLDGQPDGLPGYRSPVHGTRPMYRTYPTHEAELTGLIDQVTEWIAADVAPDDIAVTTRTNEQARQVRDALDAARVPNGSARSLKAGLVRVDTMHVMKGAEFQCMAVIGVDDDVVPAAGNVTPAEEDAVSHEQDLQRERNLLFVACLRPRDALYVSHLAGKASPFIPRP